MSSSAARIADLSKQKQALLLKRIRERSESAHRSIGKRIDFSPCPLSFGQERLWFLAQMDPDNPFYNMAGVIRLQGHLNSVLFEQALNEVIRRHEALRTSFRVIDNEVKQVIDREGLIEINRVDLSALSGVQQKDCLKRLEKLEAHRVFDLAKKPLLRASLLKFDEGCHVLLMTLHHIVADEWSLRLLIDEVGYFYERFKSGHPSDRHDLPVQYADFALWQRSRMQETLEKQAAYWVKKLENAPKLLDLPTDRPRPHRLSYRGASHGFDLSDDLSEALIRLSQQAGATLFAVMMAAFNVLLSRYSGQNDICVGYPNANRNHPAIENLIGFFVNTQVLRTDCSGNPTFSELLNRVKKNILDAQNNQDAPFERLVESLKLERESNHSPLFQVMLVYQHAPMEALAVSDLHFSISDSEMNSAKFDLILNVIKSDKSIGCSFNYSNDLFDAATIVQMEKHLQQLLERIVEDRDRPLSELSFLSAAEQMQILYDWNATEFDYSQAHCVHLLFEAQVSKTPDAVALSFENQALSYAELNASANRLAHYLRSKGVVAGSLVGLCIERGFEMAIGLLGILKAGGAYVPFDPDYPAERLSFMLEDSRAAWVLTQQSLIERLSEGSFELVCLDSDWAEIKAYSEANPLHLNQALDLAYIIYTSGSTGKPKGIAMPHRGLCNLIAWQMSRTDKALKTLQYTSLSFDVSFQELFCTWSQGGAVELIQSEERRDFLKLIQHLKDEKIERLFLPSVGLRYLSDALLSQGDDAVSLKEVIVAGDQLQITESIRRLFESNPHTALYNQYGPAECHVVTEHGLFDPVENWPVYPPIGRPISNNQIYVLDRDYRPVAIKQMGEVYIAGVCLAQAYLNQAGLTAERFVPNPYGKPGSRMYKTGDLARYRPDGKLEFIGRADHQVKIRGYRIEPGELEALLVSHPEVKEALVSVREDKQGDKRLIAYIVWHGNHDLDGGRLRDFMASKLPEYMVPSTFVSLQSMPLTATGKIDLKALPEPLFETSKKQVLPRNETEAILSGIWADLLAIEKLGMDDNFFELGGHSLLATQVISRIASVFSIDLPIRLLFEFPTVAGLAHRIERLSASQKPVCPIEAADRNHAIPLSYAQQRLWFLDQLEPGNLSYNMPTALRLKGNLNDAALIQSFNEIVRRHEILRTVFVANKGQAEQKIIDRLRLDIDCIDLKGLAATDCEIRSLCRSHAEKPFDLAEGPLIRVSVVKTFESSILLVTLHHILSDDWSSELLRREFISLYQAFSRGEPSPLAELKLQYADFAHWQRHWLTGDILQRQADYWRNQLSGAPSLLELPTDHPRPAIMLYRGADCRFEMPDALARQIKVFSRKHDATLYMSLLAAFNVLLFRYSHGADLCIGSPIANRNRLETEDLIGFFVNTLVLRSDLSGNPTFLDCLRQVRNTVLEAQNHQDFPFEQLVELLQPERNMSYSPLFQVMFVLKNAPRQEPVLQGLEVQALDQESRISKFDLTLHVYEHEQGMSGAIEYNADLFKRETMIRLTEHYIVLLQSIVNKPLSPISELNLLSQADHRRILYDWNDTRIDYPQNRLIHQLFEDQADQNPTAVAALFDASRLSYAELNAKANQLAHYLIDRGVGPDVTVAICCERSLEMIVGLMGILKAGGAYVPLDTDGPQSRIDFMLADTATPMVLTQARLSDKFGFKGVKRLCLDSEWDEVSFQPIDNPVVPINPENSAYCIYTSGSTGQPKGTILSHRGILNRLQWMDEAYRLNENDRVLQKTPYSFDVSVWEFFWPLMTGAALVIAQPDQHKDIIALIDAIVRHKITTIHFVPSMLHAFIDTPEVENCTSLKRVICSGEALSFELAQRFHRRLNAKLYNLYGPTEASVDVSSFSLTEGSAVYIGKPIANIALYILDQQLNLVPIGAHGELHIGGVGLARGYLNRFDLTAEKFIPNPFDASGGRLYKTGDLVRYVEDGDIDYLGRIDHQIKIRGFRIELGEIEAGLLEHPAIGEAVVLAKTQASGEKRLVAYFVETQPGSVQIDALKSHLKQKLPDHMVPSVFVALQEMPLSSNGKLDRKALPDPDEGLKSRYAAPENPIETILAHIWSELLGIQAVGIEDNFFELGGDSILSIQVVSRARQAGIFITPRQLFQHQTVAELASCAMQNPVSQAEQGLVGGAIALTPIQRWFFEQSLFNPHHWNQALLFEASPGLDADTLKNAFGGLIAHHDALRLQFVQEQGVWMQYNLKELPDDFFERIDLSQYPPDNQKAVLAAAASEQQARLNLSRGCLIRLAWFDRGHGLNSRFLIVIHHLAVDGVSWRILLEDLTTLLRHSNPGEATTLPAKTTSFKQWSNRIDAELCSGLLKLDDDVWLNQASADIQPLPINEPKGLNTASTEALSRIELSAAETKALLQEVPLAYNTRIDEVLLTALAQTLADWSGQTKLLIDLEGHGREDIVSDLDISRTVGWFTTLFPVCLDVGTHRAPGECLKSVKEQLRAIPQKGMGYGLLRHIESREANTLNHPLPPGEGLSEGTVRHAQILFNYLGQLDTALPDDSLFWPVDESAGASCDPCNIRSHEHSIIVSVSKGRLQLEWRYSSERYLGSTIESLIKAYIARLKGLIEHCISPECGGYTPADFDLARLSQSELDEMALIPRQIEAIYPLAPLQYGLLFHSFYAPESGTYCIQVGCRLEGALDVAAFKKAWRHVLELHSVLRTRFEKRERILQIVHKQVDLPIIEYDWRGCYEEEQSVSWKELLEEDRKMPFDFARPPLMRLGLARCSENAHYFFWSHHHVLLDGWSGPLLMKDVFEAYEAFRQGKSIQARRVRPYKDYIAWLQKQDMAQAEAYWKNALQGFDAPTQVSGEKTFDQAGCKALVRRIIPAEKTKALQDFVKQHQLTLNTLVQGAWAQILSLYSGETDIVFGATVSGRPAELCDVENRLGLFINTVPVRVRMHDGDVVLDGLKALFKSNQDMLRYDYAPLNQIQAWSDRRGQSLFESLLVFENYPIDQALTQKIGSLAIQDVSVFDQTNYPLTINIFPGSEIRFEITYSAEHFDEAMILCMLEHLENRLDAFVEKPFARLGELQCLSQGEKQKLLIDWNDTRIDYPKDDFIHRLFEKQVEKTPEALALRLGDLSLSYAELNAKANRLAHHLISKGIAADRLVGVCMERSLEMVIGLLGILKAGCAYLPLDPGYPDERLDFMIDDGHLSIVLTQSHLSHRLKACTSDILCLDTDWALSEDVSNPCLNLRPENLAYCIYTSGSTGKPKGVGVPHQGILNRLQWMQEAFRIDETDKVLQKTPFSFDVSVWEFFWPLMTGASLIVAEPEEHKNSLALIETIVRQGVTTLHFVPSMLQAFIDTPGVESCVSLKRVICSGEALPFELAQRFYQKSSAALYNLYGPTEASVDVTHWACKPTDDSVPIGRPIANTSIYLLDRQHNPVPIGAPGELYIGGIGLARGYLNRADLTAERFIPNPFGEPGSRLYKTGDLARHRMDGSIAYLGRIDHQVKIRGFRIELGEIEARLLEHPDVKESAAIVQEGPSGEKRLLAFVSTRSERLSSESLQSFLRQKLPDHMVPAAFMMLEAMPLSANGKLDRKALPAFDLGAQAQKRSVVPKSSMEDMLASIWCKVLGLESVGVDDDFFELGGDSILSLQLVNLAKERGLDLALEQVYKHTCIRQQAVMLDSIKAYASVPTERLPFDLVDASDLPLLPEGLEDAYPLTVLQAGMIFHSEYDPHAYHLIDSARLRCKLDFDCLKAAIHAVVARHPVLRTGFDLGNYSESLQLVFDKDQVIPKIGFDDWRALSDEVQKERLSAWLENEKTNVFDIAKPSLIRFHVHRLTDVCFQFTVTEHHAILDGWSLVSMLNEIFTLYLSGSVQDITCTVKFAGNETPCRGEFIRPGRLKPPLQTRKLDREAYSSPVNAMRDLVVWEREALESETCRNYWLQKISDANTLKLPLEPVPDRQDHHATETLSVLLSHELSQSLKALAKMMAVPLKSVLLAAHLKVLSLLYGDANVTTGLVYSVRPETSGADRALGVFLNTLPFPLKLKLSSWRDLILQVFDAERESLRYRFYPLAEIQRAHQTGPLFDSMFHYLHYHVANDLVQSNELEVLEWYDYVKAITTLGVAFQLDIETDRIKMVFLCDASKMSPEKLASVSGYYVDVLSDLSQNVLSWHDRRSFISDREKQKQLIDWNDTQFEYERDTQIHRLFEKQVEKTPDAIAVRFENQSLSYAGLNSKANRLANDLRAKGIGPDDLVGICMERSIEMVVGLLGILKAGGAYVPLDPGYPQDRLDFMMQDVGMSIVLTQAAFLEKLNRHGASAAPDNESTCARRFPHLGPLPEGEGDSACSLRDFHGTGAEVLCLDGDESAWRDVSDANPDVFLMPENLAYCIFTSGSTGQPKGACISHQGILNRLQWMQAEYGLDRSDSVLQKTPYSFDVSVWEFFWPLMMGARLVMARPDAHKDSLALIDIIKRRQITTLHFVPSMLQAFIDTPGVESCASIKRVICSGEALPADLARRFQQKFSAELHNLYGPTEASVDVSYWPCIKGCDETAIPIGRPIANISLYVLDRQLNPVPIGVPGELYIGGVGLGRGYLNRPELTAEKFIPDPFDPKGCRLYKTGDLVRYRADGNIDYLGRLDFQVKIRGFRIELGEIEARILAYSGVKEAVVLAREDQSGDKRLVAYCVESRPAALAIEALKAFLKETMPDYMVPAAFVILNEMPLSANGKLDRKKLPEPDKNALTQREYEAPKGEVEYLIAEIWQALLGVGPISRHDHFFELGGHSLLAMTLIQRMRQAGLHADVRMIFAAPTLAAQAIAAQKAGFIVDIPPNLIAKPVEALAAEGLEEFRL